MLRILQIIRFFFLSLLIQRIRIDCIYKGERYASGAEWSDPDDPCASFKCVAGVVTESNMQCYTPCNNPLTPRKGQCCSTCLGKFIFFSLFIPFNTQKQRTHIHAFYITSHIKYEKEIMQLE